MTQPPYGYGYGYPQPPPPPRRWYQAPAGVTGAATFTAVFAWITVALILTGFVFLPNLGTRNPIDFLFSILFVILIFVALLVVGTVTFWLTIAGFIATLPLAVAWWRGPDRSGATMLALAHAAFACLVLVVVVVQLGLVHTLL
jgi:hypothetical protein